LSAGEDQPDPSAVLPDELDAYIRTLEEACIAHPASADLLTCLGVAHAAKAEPASAQLAFEKALAADPEHFFARLRYAELLLRLKKFRNAEGHSRLASKAARNRAESAMAKRLLGLIRKAAKTPDSTA
jgi:thioredoxin-like negative regulator of GroEL